MSNLPSSTFFTTSIEAGVAHIEMAKPDKANAMSPDFWCDLPIIAEAIDRDPAIRCVVLSGQGRHFTAGMDLSAFSGLMGLTKSEAGRGALALRDNVLLYQASLSSLETLRVPVIAAIHGVCLGGGIDLITACDIRLAAQDAQFGIEEINVGMAADVGTLQRMPKLMAPGVVAELAYTGRRFSAVEAQGWGVVNGLHDGRDGVIAAALEMAAQIAAKSPLAIAGIKRSLTYARDHTVADGLEQIATWNGGMLREADLMKAMQARMAKQQADFDDLLPGFDKAG